MCTHYAPLVKGDVFLMGRVDTDTHIEQLGPENFIDLKGLKQGLDKIVPDSVAKYFK